MSHNNNNNFFEKIIHTYTRAQALADGFLIDATPIAKENGFKIPIAITNSVWEKYIHWTDEDNQQQTIQNQAGRLSDVLWMLYLACRGNQQASELIYKLYVIPRNGRSKSPMLVKLKAVIGGGDNGEPVITIMLPEED